MLNKKECPTKEEMARQIFGLFIATAAIALFFFGFLSMTADSIAASYFYKNDIIISEIQQVNIQFWIRNVSSLMALIVFVVLFLFLVGQKIADMADAIRAKEAALREEREMMIRSLSHDIRTPLTSILSYSEYMQKKEMLTAAEMEDYTVLMLQKAKQIKELTNRLLDGDRKVEMIEDGRLLMEQLADEWEADLEERFSCVINLEACPKFRAEIDIQEIRRIFDNLSSNIKKYADEKEEVYLNIFEAENFVQIEQKNRKKTKIAEVESNHLGLESIRKIARQYGGEVAVTEQEQYFCIQITLFKL